MKFTDGTFTETISFPVKQFPTELDCRQAAWAYFDLRFRAVLHSTPYGMGPTEPDGELLYHGANSTHLFLTYPGLKPLQGPKENHSRIASWNAKTETLVSSREFCRNCVHYRTQQNGQQLWRCRGHRQLVGDAYRREAQIADREARRIRSGEIPEEPLTAPAHDPTAPTLPRGAAGWWEETAVS